MGFLLCEASGGAIDLQRGWQVFRLKASYIFILSYMGASLKGSEFAVTLLISWSLFTRVVRLFRKCATFLEVKNNKVNFWDFG